MELLAKKISQLGYSCFYIHAKMRQVGISAFSLLLIYKHELESRVFSVEIQHLLVLIYGTSAETKCVAGELVMAGLTCKPHICWHLDNCAYGHFHSIMALFHCLVLDRLDLLSFGISSSFFTTAGHRSDAA